MPCIAIFAKSGFRIYLKLTAKAFLRYVISSPWALPVDLDNDFAISQHLPTVQALNATGKAAGFPLKLQYNNNMIRDLSLAAKASCSLEDQETLVPMVLQLKKLSELVTKQGVLSLENELPQIKDSFLNLGIQLIIDKVEAENIKDILDSDIYYNQSNGRELLKKIIIREGLLRIQAGDTPRNVLICTKVFLGKITDAAFRNS